jgi:hypothetical protein
MRPLYETQDFAPCPNIARGEGFRCCTRSKQGKLCVVFRPASNEKRSTEGLFPAFDQTTNSRLRWPTQRATGDARGRCPQHLTPGAFLRQASCASGSTRIKQEEWSTDPCIVLQKKLTAASHRAFPSRTQKQCRKAQSLTCTARRIPRYVDIIQPLMVWEVLSQYLRPVIEINLVHRVHPMWLKAKLRWRFLENSIT